MKNKIKMFMLIAGLILVQNTYGYNIENINIEDSKTIDFSIDTKTGLYDKYDNSELKVLENLETSSSKSINSSNKVILSLKKDLVKNYSYSILTLLGAEGNIDFTLGDDLEGVNIENPVSSGIKSIYIIDKNNIEITFEKPLIGDEFEFKTLKEIPIDKIYKNTIGGITIKTSQELETNTNYMIVTILLKDDLGNPLSFDEGIYDFKTTQDLATLEGKSLEQKISSSLSKNNNYQQNEKSELEKIALKAAHTPDTGAETWILLALTLLINTIIYNKKRFNKKLS